MPWDIVLIFFFLAVVIPWRGTVRLRKLLNTPSVSSRERMVLYLTTIGFQWLLAAAVAWRMWARGFTRNDIGLGGDDLGAAKLATGIGAVALAAIHWGNIRRAGRTNRTPGSVREVAEKILPRSWEEMVPYCALALTAGICEEFLYRGFAMASLARLGWSSWLILPATSVLFGLAHLYQGRAGFVGTTFVGLLLGAARIFIGSLIPAMAWHAVIDITAGIAGKRYLLRPLADVSS
jgi:uncharacterized protein